MRNTCREIFWRVIFYTLSNSLSHNLITGFLWDRLTIEVCFDFSIWLDKMSSRRCHRVEIFWNILQVDACLCGSGWLTLSELREWINSDHRSHLTECWLSPVIVMTKHNWNSPDKLRLGGKTKILILLSNPWPWHYHPYLLPITLLPVNTVTFYLVTC